jgi:indolepyruvate ferredoxin oxidoreductase alpha subunit
MKKGVITDTPGKKILLMGNEAVARGALEGNCQFASSYPGTPSSEIMETLGKIAKDVGIHAQWSTNEMVALWAAAGATYCGVRSLCIAKHHGVAWMTDPLINFSHWQIGEGGLVLAIGDDPGGHSSSNEYDSRNLAMKVFEIPILEPADPQEAKDFTKEGFELSEKLKTPIYVRLTTRVCHATGDVVLGELPKEKRTPSFFPTTISLGMEMIEKYGWVNMTYLHDRIHTKRLKEALEVSNDFPKNILKIDGNEELGVVASGVTRHYVEEALNQLNTNVAFLQLGMSFPLPKKHVSKLFKSVKKILVFEETDPVIENELRSFAKSEAPDVEILGKINEFTPVAGEYNVNIVKTSIANVLNKKITQHSEKEDIASFIAPYQGIRRIALCAGCPHRASGYIMKKAVLSLGVDFFAGIGDIGCYGMMGLPPLGVFALTNCMGGSVGMANGIAKTGISEPVVAYIGDSTFYHAGIPSLINATFNNTKFTTVILDNQGTAMTGFQPHPGSGYTAMGDKTKIVNIEDLVKACGIEYVEVLDPYQITKSIEVAKKVLAHPKASVIIFRRMCSIEFLRQRRKEGKTLPKPYTVDSDICSGCEICLDDFGCPALIWDGKNRKAIIDEALCVGCGNCAQICDVHAIKVKVK